MGTRHFLRKLVDYMLFRWSEPDELPRLSEEQKFLLKQFRLGLITEQEWRDLLERDPTLSAHFKGAGSPRICEVNVSSRSGRTSRF